MNEPTLTQYITDLTNGTTYLDELVAESGDKTRVKEVMDGIKYQMTLPLVADSGEDLSAFQTSVDNAQTYIDAE